MDRYLLTKLWLQACQIPFYFCGALDLHSNIHQLVTSSNKNRYHKLFKIKSFPFPGSSRNDIDWRKVDQIAVLHTIWFGRMEKCWLIIKFGRQLWFCNFLLNLQACLSSNFIDLYPLAIHIYLTICFSVSLLTITIHFDRAGLIIHFASAWLAVHFRVLVSSYRILTDLFSVSINFWLTCCMNVDVGRIERLIFDFIQDIRQGLSFLPLLVRLMTMIEQGRLKGWQARTVMWPLNFFVCF